MTCPIETTFVGQYPRAIGVGTSHYIDDALAFTGKEKAQLIVLKIDTPGGLVSATREIIQTMLSSPISIAGFVSPSGATALSRHARQYCWRKKFDDRVPTTG